MLLESKRSNRISNLDKCRISRYWCCQSVMKARTYKATRRNHLFHRDGQVAEQCYQFPSHRSPSFGRKKLQFGVINRQQIYISKLKLHLQSHHSPSTVNPSRCSRASSIELYLRLRWIMCISKGYRISFSTCSCGEGDFSELFCYMNRWVV